MGIDSYKNIKKNKWNKPGLHSNALSLINVELKERNSVKKIQTVRFALKNVMFKLMKNKQRLLVERIKIVIYQFIFISDELLKQNFSDFISKKVNLDYKYLSNLFLDMEGGTIEEYIKAQKIEYVKELLVYTNLSPSDIALKLQYNSEAQLISQFIKEVGVSLVFYRLLRNISHSKSENV